MCDNRGEPFDSRTARAVMDEVGTVKGVAAGGRPVTVGADTQVTMRQPAALVAAVREAARAEGVSAAEWWRRAARERLGR